MSQISTASDLKDLPNYQPRSFVPHNFDFYAPQNVVDLYIILLSREVKTNEGLNQWIMDRSEADAALDQAGSLLYIRMTCQTDNPQYSEAYKNFISQVVPAVRPLEDKLNQKYLSLRQQFTLDKKRYEVYDRSLQSDVELFRQENVLLQTDVQLLSQEYQTVTGAMTVDFLGQEQTLPQMSKYLQETDRSLRESAWRAMQERRLKDREKLDGIFDRSLQLRHEIALNAGCRNFMEYQFKAYHRFDYTPQDCKAYHETVLKVIVPLVEKIAAKRSAQMGLPRMRPWDTHVDVLGRTPLKPFSQVEDLVNGVNRIFDKINSDLGVQFRDMASLGLLDLESRKGKAPGGYQNTLAESRKPFIFMNAVGVDDDVRTLLHEGGHAFHALASVDEPLYPYRHAPMEFCEVASMSMELLANDFLGEFYSQEDRQRSCQSHLEDIVQLLAWVATIDQFQHWIYENPFGQTSEARSKKWVEIYEQFGGRFLDWDGLKSYELSLWHRQLHIFEVPFYYIEYGIAQLGALQIWLKSRQDLSLAVQDYRKGLSLGGSRPLKELFNAAGLNFDFSISVIEPLAKALETELGFS